MKRNEDWLKQLGLDGTWKEDQMKKREGGGAATNKRKKRSIPEKSRKSQRSTTTRGFPMGAESEVLDCNITSSKQCSIKDWIASLNPLFFDA